jgi:hypothetical protein
VVSFPLSLLLCSALAFGQRARMKQRVFERGAGLLRLRSQ